MRFVVISKPFVRLELSCLWIFLDKSQSSFPKLECFEDYDSKSPLDKIKYFAINFRFLRLKFQFQVYE